jgi:hypothetical protein
MLERPNKDMLVVLDRVRAECGDGSEISTIQNQKEEFYRSKYSLDTIP